MRSSPLIRYLIAALVAPATAPAQSPTDTTRSVVSGPHGARADSALRTMAAAGFSGVVLVAKNGEVVLEKGYGLANRETKTPMSPATVVQIGSNTKDFTIVAILQLMERGKLALADPITKYFLSVPEDKKSITIEHLLTHRAGFEQHLGPDFDRVTRDEEIARAMAAPLAFAPGSDRKYSNIGYSLLAAIIEMASGASYDTYVRDNILVPLGLHDTGLLLPRFDRRRVAHGYRDGKDMGSFLDRPLASDGPYWNLRGNGGMLSTVGDMFRFYRALMSDTPRVLQPASRDLFFHPDRPAVLAGSDMTFFFFYSRHPGAGLETILASNSTDYVAPRARAELTRALGVMEPGGVAAGGGPAIETTVSTGSNARARAAPVSTTLSDTPAGRAAKRFLDVHALRDEASARKFLETEVLQRTDDKRTLDERVAGFIRMRENLGTLTLTGVTQATAAEVSFVARSAAEGTMTFTITIEGQPPYRITGIRVTAD